ncbi:acetyl esterase/lipase [Xanthomonas campestris]|nr:acetyl esterase/lipase [Xanthomonas sp. 3075]
MIIYLHGGAFAMGSIRTHRDIARRLAQTSGFPVLLVGYSLTPASPYPAALDDVISVYEILRAGRVFPRPLAFAGDSAGGNLAIAATFRILERGREPPFALALFSPWLDLANSANKHESGTAREYMLDRAFLESAAEEYANGIRLDDPRISPINGPIHRLPPVHVCAAETELLASDSERLVQRGQELGVDAELQLWADQMHAFPTFAAVLPEGVSAVKKAAAFLVARAKTAKIS